MPPTQVFVFLNVPSIWYQKFIFFCIDVDQILTVILTKFRTVIKTAIVYV